VLQSKNLRAAGLNLRRRAIPRRSLVYRDLARKARFAKPRAARALNSLLRKIPRSQ
jgi:hypothetical protein